MMKVYIILGIIIIGSFVSGVVLILRDNKTVKSSNDVLYDDPSELLDDTSGKIYEQKSVDNTTNIDAGSDDLFDEEII